MKYCGKCLCLSALPEEIQPFTPHSYFSQASRFGRTCILFQLWLRAASFISAAIILPPTYLIYCQLALTGSPQPKPHISSPPGPKNCQFWQCGNEQGNKHPLFLLAPHGGILTSKLTLREAINSGTSRNWWMGAPTPCLLGRSGWGQCPQGRQHHAKWDWGSQHISRDVMSAWWKSWQQAGKLWAVPSIPMGPTSTHLWVQQTGSPSLGCKSEHHCIWGILCRFLLLRTHLSGETNW